MMIYMSDMIIRPSPAYCASDCIFTGSRPWSARDGGYPDYFRQVEHKFCSCLIAVHSRYLETPYFIRWTTSFQKGV